MTCGDERFRHAVGPYLLGSLDSAERAEFDRHVLGCADCWSELAELRPAAEALGAVTEEDISRLAAMDGQVALGAGGDGPELTDGPGDRPPSPGGHPQAPGGHPHAPGGHPVRVMDPPVPDTLLPRLLTRAARRDRRRRVLLGALGGIAAAAVVALTAVLVTGTSTDTPGTPSGQAADGHVMAMNPVDGGPVHAIAMMTGMPWGTKITLHCHYEDPSAASSGTGGSAGWGGGSDGSSAEGGRVYSLRVTDRSGSVHDMGSWAVTANQDTVFTGGTSVPMGQIGRIDVVAADGSTVLTAAG